MAEIAESGEGGSAILAKGGGIAWCVWGPLFHKGLLRSFLEAPACCFVIWSAPKVVLPKYCWCVDVVELWVGCVAAVWGTKLGCRIKVLPCSVHS